MPARRRGQEANRAKRRAARLEVQRPTVRRDDLDAAWTEHQDYERIRRSPVPLDALVRQRQRRERVAREVRRALVVVEADFARWRAEAETRPD